MQEGRANRELSAIHYLFIGLALVTFVSIFVISLRQPTITGLAHGLPAVNTPFVINVSSPPNSTAFKTPFNITENITGPNLDYVVYEVRNSSGNFTEWTNQTIVGRRWTNISTNSGSNNIGETSVHAPNRTTVYIAHQDISGNDLEFERSTDGGATWSNLSIDKADNVGLYASLYAPEPNMVYVSYYDNTKNDLEFSNSSNGGVSWTNSSIDTGGDVGEFTSIRALNNNTIFLSYADRTNDRVKFANSSNGGVSWTTVNVGSNGVPVETSIYPINSTTIYVAYITSASRSLYFANSTDSGANWNNRNITAIIDSRSSVSLFAVNATTIYMASLNGSAIDNDLHFFRSTDSGVTWTRTAIIEGQDIGDYVSLVATDVNTIFVSYQDQSASQLILATSMDGGTTWFTSTIEPQGVTYSSMYAFDQNTIFAAFRSQNAFDPALANSSNGGTIWTSEVNLTNLGLADGSYQLVKNATNTTGNTATSVIDLRWNLNAPAVSITSPANNSAHNAPFNLTENITDVTLDYVVYQIRNSSQNITPWNNRTNQSNWWTSFINASNITQGNYTIYKNATDETGRTTLKEIRVSIDATVPSVSKTDVTSLGSESAVINVNTDESATCRFGASNGDSFNQMTAMTTTGATTHSHNVTGLTEGTYYERFVKCRDGAGNEGSLSDPITFTTQSKPSKSVPAPSAPSAPSGGPGAGGGGGGGGGVPAPSAPSEPSGGEEPAEEAPAERVEPAPGEEAPQPLSEEAKPVVENVPVTVSVTIGGVTLTTNMVVAVETQEAQQLDYKPFYQGVIPIPQVSEFQPSGKPPNEEIVTAVLMQSDQLFKDVPAGETATATIEIPSPVTGETTEVDVSYTAFDLAQAEEVAEQAVEEGVVTEEQAEEVVGEAIQAVEEVLTEESISVTPEQVEETVEAVTGQEVTVTEKKNNGGFVTAFDVNVDEKTIDLYSLIVSPELRELKTVKNVFGEELTLELDLDKPAASDFVGSLDLQGLFKSLTEKAPSSTFTELLGPYPDNTIRSKRGSMLAQRFTYGDVLPDDVSLKFELRDGDKKLASHKHPIDLSKEEAMETVFVEEQRNYAWLWALLFILFIIFVSVTLLVKKIKGHKK